MDPNYCLNVVGVPCLSPSVWAAWIQAAGTLFALAIAIWAPWSADRRLRKLRYYSLMSLFQAVHAAMCDAAEGVQAMNGQWLFPHQATRVPRLAAALDALPLHELPDAKLVTTSIDIRQLVSEYVEVYERAAHFVSIGQARFDETKIQLSAIADEVSRRYLAAYRNAPGWYIPWAYAVWRYRLGRALR